MKQTHVLCKDLRKLEHIVLDGFEFLPLAVTFLLVPFNQALPEPLRDFVWWLVLEDPEHTQDSKSSGSGFFLPDVQSVFRVDFCQYIAKILQKQLPTKGVERYQVVTLLERLLVQLTDYEF